MNTQASPQLALQGQYSNLTLHGQPTSIRLLETILQTANENELLGAIQEILKDSPYHNYLSVFPEDIGVKSFACHWDQAAQLQMNELAVFFSAANEHQYNLRRKSAVMEFECEKLILRERFASSLKSTGDTKTLDMNVSPARQVALISAFISSNLSDEPLALFPAHNSKIDVYVDVANLAVFALAAAQRASTDVGQAIKATSDYLRNAISQSNYSIEAVKSVVCSKMHVVGTHQVIIPDHLMKCIIEAESAAAMASSLRNLALANQEKVLASVADFACLSAEVYRLSKTVCEDLVNGGVWPYDIDEEFGAYFVKELQEGTYTKKAATRHLGELIKSSIQDSPVLTAKFEQSIAHIFESESIEVAA